MAFVDALYLVAKCLVFALGVAAGECLRRILFSQFNPLRVWRRTAALNLQFPGPKSSSLLLGKGKQMWSTALLAHVDNWESLVHRSAFTDPHSIEMMMQAILRKLRGLRDVTASFWNGPTNLAACTTSASLGSMCVTLQEAVQSGHQHSQLHCFISSFSPRCCGLITVWCPQIIVISDPAIVAEVLHSRELDKVPEAYRSVTKVVLKFCRSAFITGSACQLVMFTARHELA